MAKEKKERKQWQDMTFRELDYQALIEHASSLGKEKGAEALTFLRTTRNEAEPVTDEMREKKREELRQLKRLKKDGDTTIELDERRYTDKQIEKMIKDMKPIRKHNAFEVKKLYCDKFYPDIVKKSDTDAIDDEITKALAKLQAGD